MRPGFPLRAAALVALTLAAHCMYSQSAPEHFSNGRIVDKVICREDAGQSYALYLPSGYSPAKEWPILYCLDPGARGRIPVELFAEGAEECGYIVVGSNNSRNGPFEICKTAVEAIWKDTHTRFSISTKRVFGAGMSGGARSMCTLAQMGNFVSGVVACAAGFPGNRVPKKVPFFFFGAAGTDDFNYPELRQLDGELEKVGAAKRIVTFEGGHDWPPKSVCTQAIEWLELQSVRAGLRPPDAALVDSIFEKFAASIREAAGKPGEAYLLNKAMAADFKGLRETSSFEHEAQVLASSRDVKRFLRDEDLARVQQDRRGAELYDLWMRQQANPEPETGLSPFAVELSSLKKQAEAPKDSNSRRVARRVLHGLYVHAIEQSRAEVEQKDFAAAAVLLELASAIRPDSSLVYYNLASAYARGHDKRRALGALKKAIDKGFKDGRRISEDPAFEQLRNDPALKKLLSRL